MISSDYSYISDEILKEYEYKSDSRAVIDLLLPPNGFVIRYNYNTAYESRIFNPIKDVTLLSETLIKFNTN